MTNISTTLANAEFSAPGRRESAYAASEVDAFLTDAAKAVARLEEKTDALQEALDDAYAQLEEARAASEPAPEVTSSVELLTQADAIARGHIAKAQEQAQELVTQAEAKAATIVSERFAERDAVGDEIARLTEIKKTVQKGLYDTLVAAQTLLQKSESADEVAPAEVDETK